MEEEGFAKKGSLSSLLLGSRLSPLAEPFTMKRQAGQTQQASGSLTSSDWGKPFAPSTSNHLDPAVVSSPLYDSLLKLLRDDQLVVSEDYAPLSTDKSLNETRSVSLSPAFESLLKQVPTMSGLSVASVGASSSTSSRVRSSAADLSSNGIKEIKVKSVSGMCSDPLAVERSKHEVTSEDSLCDVARKNSGTVAIVSTNATMKKLNKDEDEVDSPCWKGIQNSGNSNYIQNQLEAGPSLNPEAPHFFPLCAKGIVDYPQKNFGGIGKFPEDQLLDSPQITKPCHVGGLFPDFNCKGSANGTVGYSPAEFSLISSESGPSFSASEDYSELLQRLSECSSNCTSKNVSMMVKLLHNLSKSLVQKYRNDFDSLTEQDREMLHDSIDNLNGLVNRRNCCKKSAVSHDHDRSDMDFDWGNSYALVSTNKTPHNLVSSSTGSGVVPVLRTTAMKDCYFIDEEVHQKANMNLWIEAQSALYSTKYENHILRMKLQKAGLNGVVEQI